MTLSLNNTVKSQRVRLFDIFVLGPWLVWMGSKQRKPADRWLLYAAGTATTLYNWKNYMLVCQDTRRLAGELAAQGSRPSFDRSRLVEPGDFDSYAGCGLLL
jgi:hypothetical protein